MSKYCLNPAHADREATSRGLCKTCEQSARALIKKGQTSWQKLEASGRALPIKHSGGPKSEIQEWLLSA